MDMSKAASVRMRAVKVLPRAESAARTRAAMHSRLNVSDVVVLHANNKMTSC